MSVATWRNIGIERPVRAFERAGAIVSRRQLLRDGAGVFGGLAAAGLLEPSFVFARANSAPRPGANVGPPGIGFEMSTITDFDGVVGGSEIRGRAHGSDGSAFEFDTDMRFMHGTYVGLDERVHRGTFGFI